MCYCKFSILLNFSCLLLLSIALFWSLVNMYWAKMIIIYTTGVCDNLTGLRSPFFMFVSEFFQTTRDRVKKYFKDTNQVIYKIVKYICILFSTN